jgi:Periplasmic copper-binding protein (NosD)
MSTRRWPFVVATAAVVILSVVLAAPGLAGNTAATHGAAATAIEFGVATVPVSGIAPDSGPYTIISPTCIATGPAPLSVLEPATFYVTAAFTGAIVDECPNSVLNGSGYTITPSSGTDFGVQVNTTSGAVVENVTVGGTPEEAVEVVNSTNTTVINATSSTGMDYGVVGLYDVGLNITDSQLNASADVGVAVLDSQEVQISNSYACGGGQYGVDTETSTGVTVTNVTARDDEYGIFTDGGTNIVLANDNASGESDFGILEAGAQHVRISGLYAVGSDVGIDAMNSGSTTISDSNLSSETNSGLVGSLLDGLNVSGSNLSDKGVYGAVISFSSSLAFWADAFNGSSLDGVDLENVTQVSVADSWASHDGLNGLRAVDAAELTTQGNVFDNMTTNGNGTELIHSSDVSLTGDRDSGETYGLVDFGSTHVTIDRANTTHDLTGLAFDQDSGVSVYNSTALQVETGAGFDLSSDVELVNFTADNATGLGVALEATIDASVSDSRLVGSAFGPSLFGIEGIEDDDTTAFNNSVANFAVGFCLVAADNATLDADSARNSSGYALELAGASDLTVENGNFSSSDVGFLVEGTGPGSIVGNSFYNDTRDFEFDAESQIGLKIYWNNFIDGRGWSVAVGGATSLNLVFADGYPGGGNFWSNWTGPDTMSGPQQNLPGSDGIVDLPLRIMGTLEDPYPLTRAVSIPDTNVQFVASGLPTATSWTVAFNGSLAATTSNSLIFSTNTAALGVTLPYSVEAPSGWTASPATGSVTTVGSALVVQLKFSQVTYPVAFSQSGLPAGTPWSVTVNGTTLSGSAGSVTTPLPNGTYRYTVDPIAGYTVAPSSGSVTVASAGSTTSLAFSPVSYSVVFTEHGLPSGSVWSVTFDGVPKSQPSSTISFTATNGSYAYAVGNLSGYSTVGGSGTVQVAGPGASVQVGFAANSNSALGTGSPLFWGLIAAIAILAVALLAVLLMGRRKPPAPNAWSPPVATAGTVAPPPPAAEAPAPPPGAAGGIPDWKE